MSKIVVLTSSPRKSGNSNTMAKAFADKTKQSGHEVVVIDLASLNIKGCRVCGGCLKTGECVVKDDFKSVNDEVLSADGIVLVAPVYWYTFPAQMKALIDRWYSDCENGNTFEGKKLALISCCAEDELEVFDGIRFAFEHTIHLMKGEIVGEVLVPGLNKIGDVERSEGISMANDLAERF